MTQTKAAPFALPALPYAQNALEPYISAKTLGCHYGRHHQGYVDKLNELVSGTVYEDMKLEEVIFKTAGRSDKTGIFNNAAQAWNHDFYWNSLSPKGTGKPSAQLSRRIEADFGGYQEFLEKFAKAGLDQFGSGWVWLVQANETIHIISTPNAENPLSQKRGKALLAFDVWEHAYYPDYQNRRNDYLKSVLDELINWDFASKNFQPV